MHGDKYELRVDGMSFSHMYALNWAKGAFGQDTPSYGQSSKYDDTYEDYKYDAASKPKQDNF